MEFETKLSRETIKERLFIFAEPMPSSGIFSKPDKPKFLANWNDDTFELIKYGGYSYYMHFLPFIGKVEIRDNSSYIVGKFDLNKSTKIIVSSIWSLFGILVLFIGFLDNSLDIALVLTVFMCVAIMIMFMWFNPLLKLIRTKQRRDVIEFIKRYLLD